MSLATSRLPGVRATAEPKDRRLNSRATAKKHMKFDLTCRQGMEPFHDGFSYLCRLELLASRPIRRPQHTYQLRIHTCSSTYLG